MKWQGATIDDSCLLITDGTHYTPPDVGEGVPFLTVKDFTHDGQIDLVGCSHITEEEFQKAAKGNSAPKLGDVLFSKDGTVGKVYVVNTEERFAVLSSMAILRPNTVKLDSGYFGWVLKTETCLDQALRNKTGSAIRRIILKDLKKVRFPLPPLAEQKRIAAILDAADGLRAKRRESLAQLNTLLQSTFLDMFGDPVTNPKGWKIVALRSIADLENGDRSSNYPSGSDILEEGVLFLSTKNISDNHLMFNSVQFISEEKFRSLSRGKLRRNDLVITLRGTLGSCAIFDCEYDIGFINAQLLILHPQKTVSNKFLHAFLTSDRMRDHFGDLSTGAAVKQLTGKQIGDLSVPLPPLDLQHRFAAIVESVEQQKARLRSHLVEMDTLFASLQQRAFNGDLWP